MIQGLFTTVLSGIMMMESGGKEKELSNYFIDYCILSAFALVSKCVY
jgi:hypothetical protein